MRRFPRSETRSSVRRTSHAGSGRSKKAWAPSYTQLTNVSEAIVGSEIDCLVGMISYSRGMKIVKAPAKSTTVVSERGQVVIPKRLRLRLGFEPGQVIECREDKGRLIMTKAVDEDPVDSVYGILKTDRSSDEWMKTLRGRGR